MSEHTLLLVDENPSTLKKAQETLLGAGFAVVAATTGQEAVEAVQASGPSNFWAVITAQELSPVSGLHMLEWIKRIDNALSVIITADKQDLFTLQTSLRGGACDFLENPVAPARLIQSATTAVKKTIAARQLNTAQKSIRAIAQNNHFFKSILVPELAPYLQLHYTPHDQVGGDFVNVLPLSPTKTLLLVGDVSGHDLRAGFVSAFFQGLARGLCHTGQGLITLCQSFNKILLDDWERRRAQSTKNPFKAEARTSLALLGVEIDHTRNTATVVNCGAPSLKITNVRGCTQLIESANPPLGWTIDEPIQSTELPLEGVSYLFLATDGLHDWAESLGTNSLGLAYRLLQKRQTPGGTPPDDLLVVRYQHTRDISSEELWHPLIHLENPEKLPTEALAVELFKTLKNNLSKPPELNCITQLLKTRPAPLKRACIAVMPKTNQLKMMVQDVSDGIMEEILGEGACRCHVKL